MAEFLPVLPYDPQDDPPNDVLDRAFPKDQCAPMPTGFMFSSNGPHNIYAQENALQYGPFGPTWWSGMPQTDPMMMGFV